MPEFNKQLPHALHALHLDEFVSKITERKYFSGGTSMNSVSSLWGSLIYFRHGGTCMYRHNLAHCTVFFLGVGTKIDPTLCRADRLVGQVLGAVGALPDIYTELEISYFLLRRLLGVRTEGSQRGAKVTRRKCVCAYVCVCVCVCVCNQCLCRQIVGYSIDGFRV